MAEQDQTITVEQLSATPLSTEMEDEESPIVDVEEIVTPQEAAEQVPETPVPTQAPVTPVPSQAPEVPMPTDAPPVSPASMPDTPEPYVQAPQPVDEFTGMPEVQAAQQESPVEVMLPPLFGTYAERRSTVDVLDPQLRMTELRRIQGEVALQYTEGVVKTGDAEKDKNRLGLIREAKVVGVPKLDAEGNIVHDANGVPVLLEEYTLPAANNPNEDQRYIGNVIATFEFANNPNGIYLFYDGVNNMPTGGINLAKEMEQARTQVQGLLPRAFSRDESMQGGMKFLDDVLQARGVTRPEKRMYYLRAQARTGGSMFEGIESKRLDVMFRDMIPGLWNLGMMIGDVAENHVISIPTTMMGVVSEMTPMGELVDHGFFGAKGFGVGAKGPAVDAMMDETKRFITGARTMPLFTLTAEQWAGKYGVSVSEAEAVLGYTPDLATAVGRFAIESAVFAPTILKGARHLDNQTYNQFADFVTTKYKSMIDGDWDGDGVAPSENMSLVEISDILEDRGITFKEAFDEFAESRNFGSRAWLEGSMERAVQNRFKNVPEKVSFYKARAEALQKKSSDLSLKISEAKADVASAKTKEARTAAQTRLNNFRKQKRSYTKELNELSNEVLVPPFMKQFLVDDLGIATPIAGVTYGLLYQAMEGEETVPGLASFVAAVGSLHPRFRQGMQYSGQSLKYAGHRVLNKVGILDQAPPSPEAVSLARRLQGANPELRDRIYDFMETVSSEVEKYGNIVYPSNHPKAGQPILTEDVLYQSFSMMSGLSTLRALQEQASSRTVDIKKIGQFKQELELIERQFDERARMVTQLSEVVQNLKYLEFNEAFDPQSDAGNLVRTMSNFYKMETEQLARDKADFDNLMQDQGPVERIFSADARPEDVQAFIEGNKSIAAALSSEIRRYERYELDPNLPPIEREKALQAHLQTVQSNVAEAFARHAKFDANKGRDLASQDFVNFIVTQETIAYAEASKKFDILKTKYPEDARVDLTDIHDQLVLGEIELDMDVVDMVVPILNEGTEASRAFSRLNVDSRTGNALQRLFGESATEYMESFRNSATDESLELADSIFDELEIADASDYVKMLALRDGFKSVGMTDQLPQLGVDVKQLVQIVSGLGRSAAARPGAEGIPVRQLRASILDRARDGFYSDFYGANRSLIEGLGDEYDAARNFYRTRYIEPFRNENTTIRGIIKAGESTRDLDLRSLDRFVKHFELNQRKSAPELAKMQQQFANVIGRRNPDGSIAPLDVNTPGGKQVKSILTQLVIEELSNTMGGKTFRKILQDQRGGITGKLKAAEEFAGGVRTGDIKPESGINLGNLIGRNPDGSYKLTDVNGNPLVDIAEVDYMLSFDNIKRYVDEAKQAESQFFEELNAAKVELKKDFDASTGRIRGELLARERLVQQLGETQGGLGQAILNQFNTETGPSKIADIREDYVRMQVEKGVSEDQARSDFRQVIQQSVIDALYESVTTSGNRMTFQVVKDGVSTTETKRGTNIDPGKLLNLIGYRGDTVEASRHERAIRGLLGDKVYDHLKFVGETLYISDEAANKMNVTGLVTPLSAESQLSRLTSYFRGVISLRWLVSEAAIRESRRANSELTKLMLFDPDIGREVLDLVLSEKFSPQRFAQVYPVLLSQIAKNDVLMEGAVSLTQERENQNREQERQIRDIQIENIVAPSGAEDQMNQLLISP